MARLSIVQFCSFALLFGVLSPWSGIANAASYHYKVTLDDSAWKLAVEWSEVDAAGSAVRANAKSGRALRLCLMMEGAGRYLGDLASGEGATRVKFTPAADDADCFVATLPAGAPVTAHYSYDLAAATLVREDPDYVARAPGGFVLCDKTVLLRPDELVEDDVNEIEVHLPAGQSIAAPWTKSQGTGERYQVDGESLNAGGYLALGKVRRLPDIPVRGGVMSPALLDGSHKASDEDLLHWVTDAAAAVAEFYLGLPRPRVSVILVAVPGDKDGGVFGTVMRHSRFPSAVLLFGADAEGSAAFADDWVATHELFHLGNPDLDKKTPWLVEGFTTYYQDVLRGRRHPERAAALWGDLYDGFHRYCDEGGALAEDSREMHHNHRYTRVYWGGACLAFQADVAIRRHSLNKESLDSVLRALLKESRAHDFSEDEIVARLDHAAGTPIVKTRLHAKDKAPLADLYRQLGIEPTGATTVKLHDDAPLSATRKAIF